MLQIFEVQAIDRYVNPANCSISQYFDISQLICRDCPSNSSRSNEDCK